MLLERTTFLGSMYAKNFPNVFFFCITLSGDNREFFPIIANMTSSNIKILKNLMQGGNVMSQLYVNIGCFPSNLHFELCQ